MSQQSAKFALLIFSATGLLSFSIQHSAAVEAENAVVNLPVASHQERQSVDLFLEVSINGSSRKIVGNFVRLPSGAFAAMPDELAEIGIKPLAAATNADGLVILDRLPNVTYAYDEQKQHIEFTADDTQRSVELIDASRVRKSEAAEATSALGAVLDYTIYSASNSLFDGRKDLFRGVSGSFDGRIFSRYGVLRNSFIASYGDDGVDHFRRLNSSWSYSDPVTMISYRAGDIVSGGLTWTRPVYLGGLQIARNFSLRSDLTTQPMPAFSGSAAVPSTIEVYTQNALTYSGSVPSGPFQLVNIPAMTGQGEARVVIRDSLGRETVTTLPFYSSNMMLKQGLFDYSLEVGAPRRNYGLESADYTKDIFGSFTARYGARDWLTVEGHVEGGASLINGGAGVVFPLHRYGAASVALAGSNSPAGSGGLLHATVQLNYERWSIYGRIQRAFGDYEDIATVTARSQTQWQVTPFHYAKVAKSIDQISASIPLPGKFSNLNLAYTRLGFEDRPSSQVASLSYSHRVFKNATLYTSVFKDFSSRDSYGIYAGLSFSFGNGIHSSSGVHSDGHGQRLFTELSKNGNSQYGRYGWRARTAEGDNPNRSLGGHLRTKHVRADASLEQVNDDTRVTGQLEGSVVAAGGDVFLTDRIHDAFAVVNVGAPDVPVFHQNRPAGKANRRGKAIVTNLNSYQNNPIAIDPHDLPVDAIVPNTKQVVVPRANSGVVVDFGLSAKSSSALVGFIDSDGKALPVSSTVQLNGSKETFVIGYEGQAFMQNLKADNKVRIELDNGQSCKATFPYRAVAGSQVLIEKVVCQ